MNMIKKVEHAIYQQLPGGLIGVYTVNQIARAAIKAMLEPSDEMIETVKKSPYCLECGYDCFESHPDRPYQAMIRAALEE